MKIRIDTIKNIPYELAVSHPVECFPILLEMQNNGECTFLDMVTGHVTLHREHDHFTANGSIHVPVSLPCSRCLTTVDTFVNASFKVIYRKESDQQLEIEDETELTEEDLVSSLYSGDELDIAHEIEMQVAMGVPVKPLCKADCKGLCSGCGANLTTETCLCEDRSGISPFSVLKNYKVSR